jgi:hypothetical protein
MSCGKSAGGERWFSCLVPACDRARALTPALSRRERELGFSERDLNCRKSAIADPTNKRHSDGPQ